MDERPLADDCIALGPNVDIPDEVRCDLAFESRCQGHFSAALDEPIVKVLEVVRVSDINRRRCDLIIVAATLLHLFCVVDSLELFIVL